MLETVLHTGIEHPNLLWIFIPALLTFAAGFKLGTLSGRLRDRFSPDTEPATK